MHYPRPSTPHGHPVTAHLHPHSNAKVAPMCEQERLRLYPFHYLLKPLGPSAISFKVKVLDNPIDLHRVIPARRGVKGLRNTL
jgi:hypothetical protein